MEFGLRAYHGRDLATWDEKIAPTIPTWAKRIELEVTWWEFIVHWGEIRHFLARHPEAQLRVLLAVKPVAIAEGGWLYRPLLPPWVPSGQPYEPLYGPLAEGEHVHLDHLWRLLQRMMQGTPGGFRAVLPMGPYSEWWFPYSSRWEELDSYIDAQVAGGYTVAMRLVVLPGFPPVIPPEDVKPRQVCAGYLQQLRDGGATMVMAGAGNPKKLFTSEGKHPFDVEQTLLAPPAQRAAEMGQGEYQEDLPLMRAVIEDCQAAQIQTLWLQRTRIGRELSAMLAEQQGSA